MTCKTIYQFSVEDAVVEQFLDKCLYGNLKARLCFEPKLTIQRIIEIASDMDKCSGKNLRFEKPEAEDLYKTFPNKFSLEAS